jgi:hypothetical protein
MSEFFAQPGVLVRAENAAGLILTLLLYARTGDSWVLFLVLFLTPDISMLGYLAGPRAGAIVYNAAHAYLLPALLAAGGLSAGSHWLVSASLILFAHIAFDRLLGFGLKYPSGFKDTHIQRL